MTVFFCRTQICTTPRKRTHFPSWTGTCWHGYQGKRECSSTGQSTTHCNALKQTATYCNTQQHNVSNCTPQVWSTDRRRCVCGWCCVVVCAYLRERHRPGERQSKTLRKKENERGRKVYTYVLPHHLLSFFPSLSLSFSLFVFLSLSLYLFDSTSTSSLPFPFVCDLYLCMSIH